MKKLIVMILLVCLPLTALADGPAEFADGLKKASPADFARACEAALADTTLAGSTVAEKDGVPIAAWNEYYAFAVMRRTDGLLMLCHFTPMGEGLLLEWHNDLLISCYQDVSLSMDGAVWSDGSLPVLRMNDNWTVTVTLCQLDGTHLVLTGDLFRDGWRVIQMSLHVSADGENYHAALILPEDCLADDIYLATCMPGDWRRGEREEAVQYGW